MPIWSVMCFHMPMMSSAMPFTSCNHCFRKSGVSRMAAAIWAPLRGGLEYMGWIKIFNCDSTLLASSASLQTIVKAPTRSPYKPMFLAYDWQRQTLMSCLMKGHTAQASLSPSPLAKPW
uniref:Secreted protein n=1 Tax=Rhinopithecus bieti TaxID=61621 RepID=A0A2K6M6U5_RHIBE